MKTRLFLLISMVFFMLITGYPAKTQYAFSMTPEKGSAGTYITFTGSGFHSGKLLTFMNTTALPVVYTTAHHAVVRVPQGAQTGRITLQMANTARRFIFPKPFTVEPREGIEPRNPGLYIAAIDTDDSASNVFLFHSPSPEGKTAAMTLGADPIDYREIQSIASGDVENTCSYETALAVARKPYRNDVPVTAIYFSSDVKNLYFGNAKRIFGFSHYRNVNSLTIAPFWGDKIYDLIYSVENHEENRVFVYLKISSMPRDIPLFSVPLTAKLRLLQPVDFQGNQRSELSLVYQDKELWHLGILKNFQNFTPVVVYKGKAEITATASGDMNGDGKHELYFATYENGQAKLYARMWNGEQKLLFTRKDTGVIMAIALADLNKDGKEEIICSFHKRNTSTVYYSTDAQKIGLPGCLILYQKNNWKVTAMARTRF